MIRHAERVFPHSPDGYCAAHQVAVEIRGQLSRDRRGYVVDPPETVLTTEECRERGERHYIADLSGRD